MSDRFYAATRKGLFTAERQGGSPPRWKIVDVSFLGDDVTAVLPDPRTGRLYAALRLGHFGAKLHRSDDGGASWEECSTPRYPERPAETDDGAPWSVQQIWALAAGSAAEPGVLWAGDLPGGLHRSDDGGDSWQLVRALWERPERARWTGGGYRQPGLHSISVDPRDGRCLAVGISVGGVWATHDGGGSWQPATRGMRATYMPPDLEDDPCSQDPHALARCAAAPDVVWCQHHSGVYRSADGGGSWAEVTSVRPSRFGFAAAVHPHDPDSAWFVPVLSDDRRIPPDGRLSVARTRDGGRSFETLGRGLPQEHAYHLVLRHALDVSTGGERLAMGSNIGGLWVSEDGGESWLAVSNDLPPLASVRFAAG